MDGTLDGTTINCSKSREEDTEVHVVHVDEILNYIGFGLFQVIAFLLAGLTYLAFEFEAVGLSFIFIELSKKWNLSGLEYAITPAITCFTNIVGQAVFGYLTDWYGRIWPYALSAVVLFGFLLASAFSPNYIVFAVLRGLASIGVGAFASLAHLTLMEFLPVKRRGSVAILTGIIQFIGGSIGIGLAWWLIPRYTDGWRYFTIATAVPSFVVIIFRLLFYVESPRFLVSQQKFDQAWESFSIVASFNRKDLSQMISKADFVRVLSQASFLQCHQVRQPFIHKVMCIFKSPYRHRTLTLFGIFLTQGFAYYGSALFFPTLLQNMGLSPYFSILLGFLAMIPGILLMSIIMEWPEIGRKNVVRIFTAFVTVAFFLFAFVQNSISIPVLTVLIFFAMGPLQTFIIIYVNESYPTEIRATVVSLMTISSELSGMWVPFISGYLADESVHYTWLSPAIWGSVFAVEFLISLLLRHETRQRNLKDVI